MYSTCTPYIMGGTAYLSLESADDEPFNHGGEEVFKSLGFNLSVSISTPEIESTTWFRQTL